MKNPIKDRVREFIGETFNGIELSDQEKIFDAGPINSMFAMQLVLFVEQEFGISLNGEDLNLACFQSIDAIDALVVRKLAA